jgi:hypothetical protein
MDEHTEHLITQQLIEAEKHAEQVKAELYSTLGRISALRNLLAKPVSNVPITPKQ